MTKRMVFIAFSWLFIVFSCVVLVLLMFFRCLPFPFTPTEICFPTFCIMRPRQLKLTTFSRRRASGRIYNTTAVGDGWTKNSRRPPAPPPGARPHPPPPRLPPKNLTKPLKNKNKNGFPYPCVCTGARRAGPQPDSILNFLGGVAVQRRALASIIYIYIYNIYIYIWPAIYMYTYIHTYYLSLSLYAPDP